MKPDIEKTPLTKIQKAIADTPHGVIDVKVQVYENQASSVKLRRIEKIYLTEKIDSLQAWNMLMAKLDQIIREDGSGQTQVDFFYKKKELKEIVIEYNDKL